MHWTIRFERVAAREFRKLDSTVQRRIRDFFEQKIQVSANPRQFGKPLKGKLTTLWRYRLGDYRLVCDIKDESLVILVVRVAHRSKAYR